jgi:hypothetical protein
MARPPRGHPAAPRVHAASSGILSPLSLSRSRYPSPCIPVHVDGQQKTLHR